MQVVANTKGGFLLQATYDEARKILGLDQVDIRVGRDYPVDKIWEMLDGVRQGRKKLLESAQRLTQAAGLLMREDPLLAEMMETKP